MAADASDLRTARDGGRPGDGVADARPLVSVITPVFNAAGLLPRCLDSVARQTLPGVEHLVVDGGSTDGTVDLLRARRVAWWVSEPDRGVFDAMNKGIRAARGRRLYFLGADDVLAAPDVLERCAPALAGDAAVVFGDVRYPGGPRVRSRFGPRLLLRNAVHHQGAFYARDLFDGWAYDPELRLVADYDLNLRVYRERRRVTRVDVLVAECGEGGVSRTQLRRAFRETNLVRVRHLGPAAGAALGVLYAGEFALSRIVRRLRPLAAPPAGGEGAR